MTQEQLSLFAGLLLSLLVEYVPGVNKWFTALSKRGKAAVMAIALIAAATGVFVTTCWLPLGVVCSSAGGLGGLIQTLLLALVANQASYGLLVKPYQDSDESR